MATYKLRNKNAAGLMASSPLYNGPNLDEVSYFGVDSKKYQSSLADRMKTNPDGYFSYDSGIQGFGSQLYDKQFYGKDDKGNLQLNKGYSMTDGRLTLNAPKTTTVKKEKPKATNTKPKNLDLESSSSNKGSIGNLPKTGNLQVQNWGDVKDTTLGHGPESRANKISNIVGVGGNLKGEYTNVNTGKGKGKASSSKSSNAKGPQNKDFKVIKDGSGNSKKSSSGSSSNKSASTSIKPMQGLVDLGASSMIDKIGADVGKTAGVVAKALSPSYDLISNRSKSGGRIGRVARRQQAKTDRVLGRLENRENKPQQRAQIKNIRETERTKRQSAREKSKMKREVDKDKPASTIKTNTKVPKAGLEKQKVGPTKEQKEKVIDTAIKVGNLMSKTSRRPTKEQKNKVIDTAIKVSKQL
jgi:hypothetical protein